MVVVTVAAVKSGSANVRGGPSRATVRAPSVIVATTSPDGGTGDCSRRSVEPLVLQLPGGEAPRGGSLRPGSGRRRGRVRWRSR